MFFDLSNYLWLIIALSAIYVIASTFAQENAGGKGRLRTLQAEMRQTQMRMMEAGKRHDNKTSEEEMGKYWKQTSNLFIIQMQMLFVLLIVLASFMWIFPQIEPGAEDDIKVLLYDDGAAAHCDSVKNDGNYSGCLAIPAGGNVGAWTADFHLYSPTNESLSKNATAIYVEAGTPEDVWLQAQSQNGLIDPFLGKTAYHMSVSEPKNVTRGQTVTLVAAVFPSVPAGARIEASANAGTHFYVDLPFTLPLINIRRIIGSYGVFIFFAFVAGVTYSIGKAVYTSISKKK